MRAAEEKEARRRASVGSRRSIAGKVMKGTARVPFYAYYWGTERHNRMKNRLNIIGIEERRNAAHSMPMKGYWAMAGACSEALRERILIKLPIGGS